VGTWPPRSGLHELIELERERSVVESVECVSESVECVRVGVEGSVPPPSVVAAEGKQGREQKRREERNGVPG